MNQEEVAHWFNLSWWIAQIKRGFTGPRAVVSIVVALIGVPCSICPYIFGCPIHIPILALFAGFFSVRQERIRIREEGGVVGAVSAVIVALIQLLLIMMAFLCVLVFAFSYASPSLLSSEYNYSVPEMLILGPLGIISSVVGYMVLLMVAGIVGYFTGYLSVTAE